KTDAIGNEQARNVLVLDNRDPQFLCLACQRVENRAPGVVAGVAGPPILMRAEEALVQPAILERREAAAPGRQLTYRGWRLPRHDLHDPWMAEEVSLPKCVGKMLLPGVLRVTRAQHRVDATRRQDRMGIETVPFPDHQHLAPRLRRGDRRAQPGRASADDENIADPAPGGRFRHLFGHATQEAELWCWGVVG